MDIFGAAFFGVGLALSMALSRLRGIVLTDRWPFPVIDKVIVSEKKYETVKEICKFCAVSKVG